MLDFLKGQVVSVNEKNITLLSGSIGFAIHLPRPERVKLETEITLHTYLHWNQENGPSLFGFLTTQERTVFLLIIDCPKIGPSLALNILSQLTIGQFIDAIATHSIKTLSSVSGVGEKKAEGIIVELKNKVQKMLLSGQLQKEDQQSFTTWHQVSEVLVSLNYSRQEIAQAMTHLSEKYANQNYPLDQLIRSALTFLSQAKVLFFMQNSENIFFSLRELRSLKPSLKNTQRQGFSLIELMLVVAIVTFLLLIALPHAAQNKQSNLKQPLSILELTCQFVGQSAQASQQPQKITFDLTNQSYTFARHNKPVVCQLPPSICFGTKPNVYGPPANPTQPLATCCTFPSINGIYTLTFYPNRQTSSGAIYILDKKTNELGALTCGVSQVSYTRTYLYQQDRWNLINL